MNGNNIHLKYFKNIYITKLKFKQKMKKFFTILFTVILLVTSCTITDITRDNLNLKETEVLFKTNASSATKAIVEGTEMVDNFGVYGWVVPGTYTGDGGYLMSNAEYLPTGNAANDGSYYWPKSDNNANVAVIFTAYSQFDGDMTLTENDSLLINIPALSQDLISNPDNFNDVLWAQTKVNHHQDGNVDAEHERVQLNFKHVLSWLQFRAEVVDNSSIQWVKIKSIKFSQYTAGQPAVEYQPAVEAVPAYDDTTDTWINLKRGSNVIGSATKLQGPGESTYTNAAALPDELVNEIKSYYSIDGGDAADYDLHLGNTVWPSATIKKLRVVKAIPETYKKKVTMYGTDTVMEFFDAFKYLQDNGYDIQPANSGGKPDVWNYILLDAFVNGSAYTIVGLNWGGDSNSTPQYTIVHHEAIEGHDEVPAQEEIPEGYIEDGIYTIGTLVIPTKNTWQEEETAPTVVYAGTKNTTLNYCSKVWTLYPTDKEIIANALIVPQPVPDYITVTFDICLKNTTGDAVTFTDRKISRRINTGKDMMDVQYVASWLPSNKYIYNFKFDGEKIDFEIGISDWTVNSTNNYHVWDY